MILVLPVMDMTVVARWAIRSKIIIAIPALITLFEIIILLCHTTGDNPRYYNGSKGINSGDEIAADDRNQSLPWNCLICFSWKV